MVSLVVSHVDSAGWNGVIPGEQRETRHPGAFTTSLCRTLLDASSQIGVWDKLRWHDGNSPRKSRVTDYWSPLFLLSTLRAVDHNWLA